MRPNPKPQTLNPAVITSRQHPVCKLVRALHDGKDRRRHQLFVVEGGNGVAAALGARWPLQRLLLPEGELAEAWKELAQAAGVPVEILDGEVLKSISEVQTAPDVIALAKMPGEVSDWNTNGLLLVLDGIADPGNIGTLIRAADAAGANAVIATQNSADAFGPKAVRASAGSLFHLPPLQIADRSPQALADELQKRQIPIIAALAHGGANCFEFAWPRRCALILGHETRGIAPELEDAAAARVSIPIFGRAESLNVATAGAVLLYAWRQRVTG